MKSISVVILSRNAVRTISDTIISAKKVTTDIIVMDSGSTDGTLVRARELGAKVIDTKWKGFGETRNEGVLHAINDFILYLDSDEVISPELVVTLTSTTFHREVLYGFQRRNFVGKTEILHGEWAHDIVYRLHHRSNGQWSPDEVHEVIVVDTKERVVLKGSLIHYTTDSIDNYANKLERYASLSASKYFNKKKSAGLLKPVFAASFNFIKNYIFRLGLLDGILGWQLARLHAGYTFNKYKKLRRMYKTH